ncbi:MAG: hypothetical protein A4E19_02940 [Nitrospira sp. SG-bin1]|nr:MAG: hypothetical protein A4E19_02940 [Nitrospira sp. SG-bin1]
MQRLMAPIVAFFVLLLLSPSAFSQSFVDKAKNDSAVDMSDEDPAMQKAMERARAGLDDFLKKVGSPPPNTDQYSVKVRVSEGDNLEYLWVSNLKAQGDLWSGRIDNLPMIRSVKKGQSYSFAKTEIVDWTYIDKSRKKVVGNFTTCALLTKEPPDVAESIRKQYGLECDR